MTLSKVISAQDEVPTPQSKVGRDHKNDLDWPKTHPATITPKIAVLALSRDPTAVTLAANHFIFIK